MKDKSITFWGIVLWIIIIMIFMSFANWANKHESNPEKENYQQQY